MKPYLVQIKMNTIKWNFLLVCLVAVLTCKAQDADSSKVETPNRISVELTNRKIVKYPIVPNDEFNKAIVVLEIIVNPFGTVINAKPGLVGSTTTNPKLLAMARQIAFNTKFDRIYNDGNQTGIMRIGINKQE